MKSGSLAQLVEQLTFNQLVAGSNPARPTIFFVFVLSTFKISETFKPVKYTFLVIGIRLPRNKFVFPDELFSQSLRRS
jgi:hypothetical protein